MYFHSSIERTEGEYLDFLASHIESSLWFSSLIYSYHTPFKLRVQMIKKITLLAVLLQLSVAMVAQGLQISEGAAPLSTIDHVTFPRLDNAKLWEKYKSSKETRAPKKFAAPIVASLSPDTRGTWESIPGERMLWRMSIASPNAYSLNIGFTDFNLPASAVMFLYSSDRSHVIGPITNHDNDVHKEWWSPIIPGDEVVIEIQIDKNEVKNLAAEVTRVNHDFSGFGALLSGSCNVDVNCSEEEGFPFIDEYRDIINSVGMYSINGVDLCSGSLINTTRNDCTPYFLTAFHCEVDQNNAPSVVVYWNYENSICRAPNSSASGSRGDGTRDRFSSGTSVISGYDASDFMLLLLDDEVNAEYSPFYAGWDADGEVFDTTFSIHHPNNEEKRISFDFDPVTAYADNVFFRIGQWEVGTTEGGSSGAPLFNTDKRVIGQLNGGLASCNNNDFDDYGMIKVSWEGGGTPTTRLKDWLDPDNTGLLQTDGRSCRDVVSISPSNLSFCTSDQGIATLDLSIESGLESGAQVELVGVPEGITASLSSSQVTATENVQISLDATSLTESYIGLLGVKISDEFTSNISYIRLSIDVDVPDSPAPLLPANNTPDINFDVQFEWTSTGQTYQLQLSQTSNFIVVEGDYTGLTANTRRLTGLEPNTTYYWRVRAQNECGTSDFGAISSFTTGNIVCSSTTSTDGPITIIEQANTVVSTISIEEDAEIADLNILNVTGTHTWISDLEFRLIGPNGLKIDLLLNGCEDQENFNVSFDDESENINLDCPFLGGKAYRPVAALAAFKGISAKGDWTLEITDDVFLDGGAFESWTLELCLVGEKANVRNLSATPAAIEICENTFEPISINVQLSGDYEDEVQVSLLNGENNEILGESISASPTEAIELLFADFDVFSTSTPSLIVQIEDGIGVESFSIPVSIVIDEIDTELSSPADQESGVELNPTLTWSSGIGTVSSLVELFDMDNTVVWDTTLTDDSDSVTVPFKLDQLTTYTWRVATTGKCSPTVSSAVYSFVTKMSTSTQEIRDAGINIFPNPTSTDLSITIDGAWGNDSRLTLYNMKGQLMRTFSLHSIRHTLDLDGLSEGLYFYEIKNGTASYIHKLIVMP